MARRSFGGGLADYTMMLGDEVTIGALTGNNVVAVGGQNVTFWTAETGGTQHTDLLDSDGVPTAVIVSADGTGLRTLGQIPPFHGPDGITTMWAQAGENGARAIMVTTDAADTNTDVGTLWPPLSVAGAIVAGVGAHRLYNDTTAVLNITAVRASLGTAGSTDTVIDVNRNGTTIFPTQTDRLRVAAGQNTSGKVVPTEVTQLSPGDYVTVDVDSAGGGAADLVVQILMTRA